MMNVYLGSEYSDNHLKNFCLYWMKGRETEPEFEKYEDSENFREDYDEWRKKNDLDCLYFGGDLRADTLMSAWTPISWVANCLNREYGMKFCKKAIGDPNHYLRLLAEDRDAYLPPKHELVQFLDRFLELAELRCNYILLPDREMNRARYNCEVYGIGRVRLYDEVPPMLYHIFDKDWFGRYFEQADTESVAKSVQTVDAVKWVKRERLDVGFRDGIIDQDYVIPLLKNLHPGKGKNLKDEAEIREALTYMINLLEARMKAIEKTQYIAVAVEDEMVPNLNRGYHSEYRYGEALMEDGTIIPLFSEAEYNEVRSEFESPYSVCCTGKYPNGFSVYVRKDYNEMFESKLIMDKTFFSILHEMAMEVTD
jgi:hypothetical protein